jgi:hypothetical protein
MRIVGPETGEKQPGKGSVPNKLQALGVIFGSRRSASSDLSAWPLLTSLSGIVAKEFECRQDEFSSSERQVSDAEAKSSPIRRTVHADGSV